MEKYRRVETPKTESKINENEIRITAQGRARSYISYATNLLQTKGATEIVLKAMGYAINKTITVAEIIKRRVPDLHQITLIDSTDIKEVWEPIEEGLDNVETIRHVSSIQITLSKQPLDTNAPGYQPPLPADQVGLPESKPYRRPRRGGRPYGGGRGRGGAGPTGPTGAPGVGGPSAPVSQELEGSHRGGFRGRGGRGRGGRGGYRGGRGRGGYFHPGDAHQQHQQHQQHQPHQQQPFGGSVGAPIGGPTGPVGGVGGPVGGVGGPVGGVGGPVGGAPGGRGRGRGGRGRGGRGRGRGARPTSMAPMAQGHAESVPPQNP